MIKRKRTTKLSKYPIGTFLDTDKGYFYVASESKLYLIISKRLLHSWSPPRMVRVPYASLKGYRITSKLKFRNGSILKSYADGRVFLIENGKRRHLTSPDRLEQLGSNGKDVIIVSMEELNLHQEGEAL